MECDNSVNPVGNRPRLLVAEDNPSNYKLVEVLLRRDYDLLHAWNGEEAVALFADCRPDLVLMDINMPVMDGYEALRGVREISPDVPVIALTAYAFETDATACSRPVSTNVLPNLCGRMNSVRGLRRCFRDRKGNYDQEPNEKKSDISSSVLRPVARIASGSSAAGEGEYPDYFLV